MIYRGAIGDEVEMGRILSGWIDETPWMPRLRGIDDDLDFCRSLLLETNVFTVLRHERVEGFMSLDQGEVRALYLSPEARGQGLGASLLDAARAECSAGFGLWTFHANEAARRFYLRQGLVETERTDGQGTDEGLPDIRMEWRRS